MILEKINNEKYLITLSKEDVCILDSSFEKLTINDDTENIAKKLIRKMLLKADLKKFFFNSKNKFNIELSLKDEKYSIFISKKGKTSGKNIKKTFTIKEEPLPYIFKFKNLEDFIKCCKKINKKNFKVRNSLIFHKNNYYAVFYFKDIVVPVKYRIILTEYASFVGKGWTKMAKILEFCEAIVSKDAVGTFSKFF